MKKIKIKPPNSAATFKISIRDYFLKKIILEQQTLAIFSFYDCLTGLVTFPTFSQILQYLLTDARQYQYSVGLIYIDIDNFVRMNDSLGHLAGDKILIEISQRLKTILPEEVLISRAGEDEFALIFTSGDIINDSKKLAQLIFKELTKPYSLIVDNAKITISMGVAFLTNDKEATSEQLISDALHALKQAQKKGGNQIIFF